MRFRFYLFLFVGFLSQENYFSQNSDCSNLDFEDGNLDNWTTLGNVQLVNKDQTDIYGGFALALSGYYGAKLGNNTESFLTSITKTITITNSNKYFIYGFAIVLLGYPHDVFDAAYVNLKVQDQNGVSIPCTEYIIHAESSVGNGFYQSPLPDEPNLGGECCYPIFYKPWEITALDMTNFIGQTLTFTIESAWCVYNVDWGYAYVDAYCSENFFHEYINCEDGLLYLSAVEGLSGYTWNGPGIVSGQGANVIQIDQPGDYNLFVPNNNPNCPPLDLLYVATTNVVPDIPVADFNETPYLCINYPFQFENQSQSDSYFTNIDWNFGDGDSSNLFSPSHIFDSLGQYQVTLYVTNESSCIDSISYIMTITETPELELGPDLILCEGEVTQISPYSTLNGNFLWSTGETTSIIEVDEPQQIVLEYTVGCTVSDTINIIDVGNKFGPIPNVITVNSDLINDEFVLSSGSLAEFSIIVTNRWGGKIFESNDINQLWDGKFDNQFVEEGVYFYMIQYRLDCQKEMHNRQGHVTVVR